MAGVLSEQAKHGLNLVFSKAARANLIMDATDRIELEQLHGAKFYEPPEKNLLVLTVASYEFRLLTIFHVDIDKATEHYFSKGESSTSDTKFGEVFGEIGNRCCGAMNRELGHHFMHLGMSTPYMLESKCLPFLNELKPTHVSQYKIRIKDSVSLHATLCFCAYAPIDFRIDTSVAEEVTGELELF